MFGLNEGQKVLNEAASKLSSKNLITSKSCFELTET